MTATPTEKWHDRAALGLGNPIPSRLALRTPAEVGPANRGITAHWTGSGGTLFRPDPIERLRAIWDYHVNTLGYGDIAYAGAFDGDGNAYGLRDAKYVQAHAASPGNEANRVTDGIVFLEDERGLTPAALAGLSFWTDLYRLGRKGRFPEWFAHEYWARANKTPTACPGYLTQVVRFIGGHV